MPDHAFVSIGSNLEPEKHLRLAVEALERLGRVVGVSRAYQSAAITPDQAERLRRQPDYLNAAAWIATELSPLGLRQALRAIEKRLGRVRGADKFSARTIDLDLCLYGSLVRSSPELTLPHPEILRCACVAVPLADLSPDLPHPVTGETLASLAKRLKGEPQLTYRPDVDLRIRQAASPGGPVSLP